MGAEGRFIQLAQAAPFQLGEILVDPPTRQVVRGGVYELLEPRVMQVLVVLAEARGKVVSRDELIERCWGGRIVGENAIHRVVSRIRQMTTETGCDTFQLETIKKVGYRLVVPTEAVDMQPSEPAKPKAEESLWPAGIPGTSPVGVAQGGWKRRALVLGGASLALAGGGLLWRSQGHRPPQEALELYRRGQIAQRQGQPEQVRQAVSLLKTATEIDPLFADAWGALALAYRHTLEGYSSGEMDSLPRLIESASSRALSLDPDNADALIARVIIKPHYRHWGEIENALLRLEPRFPKHWFLLAQLGIIRYEVGRWAEGIAFTERELEVEPYIPVPHVYHARALWSLGRLQEADKVLERALSRWPSSRFLWSSRFELLLFTGRPASAAAFVLDPQLQPDGASAEEIARRRRLALAIEARRPADVEASLAALRGFSAADIAAVPAVVPAMVALGRADEALHWLRLYYLGGGKVAPPGRFERRYSAFLFMPPMAPMHGQPGFAALLEALGLDRYWRVSGSAPDFRRG